MRRAASKEVEHIDLGEGDWVDLRLLTFGDRQAILGVMARAEEDVISAETIGGARLEAGNVMMLQRAIVAWGGAGFGCTCSGGCRHDAKPPHAPDCKAWPISLDQVRGLDETGDILLHIVDAKQDKWRKEGSPFLLPRDTSPSSADAAAPPKEATSSLRTSTSGPSSESGTTTPEPPSA